MSNTNSLKRVAWIGAFVLGSILLAALLGWITGFPFHGTLIKALLLGAAVLFILWLAWRVLRIFLWRVGRRLAFSYFLLGILPIPMVTLFAALVLYLLGGYFLGHLYRDASNSLQRELDAVAELQLRGAERAVPPNLLPANQRRYAHYLDGRRVAGSRKLPATWPGWLDEDANPSDQPSDREDIVAFVSTREHSLTMAAARRRGRRAILVLFDGDLGAELSARSGIWTLLAQAADREDQFLRINMGGRDIFLRTIGAKPDDPSRGEFFQAELESSAEQAGHWWQKPFVWWGELAPPLRRLDDGEEVSPYVTATLNGAPATIYRHLLSSSGEVDAAVWGSLIVIAGFLLSIYSVAIVMAFFMIFTLTRAVNQLSQATESVREGDFSIRIPVRRHDQIGELHESFNEMAAGLEQSVAAVAQKEILEKELEIARELQQKLLPRDIPSSDGIEFATLFEPSAAIGGDYFDILRVDSHRLMVVIADVSGHGLPTGLRMAMLKAALVILVQDGRSAVEIFGRLSSLIRSEQESRFFVTCTLAEIDFRRHTLALTNAGHPPTYLVRGEGVLELELEGNPLGALGESYGQKEVPLEGGDILVWLSDGLIEATNRDGEPFGYERLQAALAGPSTTAAEVNQRLISSVDRFARQVPPDDDRTLVSMRYSADVSEISTPKAEKTRRM